MKPTALVLSVLILVGCASMSDAPMNTPPEFNQKIQLIVSDDYEKFQATRSVYDLGDLQSFHSQHTFPIKVKSAFEEVYGQVELLDPFEAAVEMGAPDVGGIFEVQMVDLAHDIYVDVAESYRANVTVAVAMKSPHGHIFWQKMFRGEGFYKVRPSLVDNTGPEVAVVNAINDALDQIQQAMIRSSQVRLQMQHYRGIDDARSSNETGF